MQVCADGSEVAEPELMAEEGPAAAFSDGIDATMALNPCWAPCSRAATEMETRYEVTVGDDGRSLRMWIRCTACGVKGG
jgi:hypothetical protein